MSDLPQIFAFYSFKGGVGRSMALVNLAYAMAAKGRNVLVLDMDLEAPGLSGFMRRQKEISQFARHDMVDLLLWMKQTADRASEAAPLNLSSLPPLSDYVVRVPPNKLDTVPERYWGLGRLDVIPIDDNRDYYNRLSEVAIAGMDRDTLLRVGSLLRSWLKSRRIPLEAPDYYGPVPDEDRVAPYDYVFIDSRTGITEVGGLCIGPLSDQLVVFCGLNDQNVEGTRHFLTEVGVLKPSSDTAKPLGKPTLFVASPLPIGEMTTKSERVDRLKKALGPIKPRLFKLSYHPQMALMETIFVRDHRDELLSQEYRSILKQLLERNEANSDLDLTVFYESSDAKEPLTDQMRKLARALLRSTTNSGSAFMLFFILVEKRDLKTVTADVDFQLMDQICRAATSHESSVQLVALGRWSEILSQWGMRSTDLVLAARRFDEAIIRIDRIINNPKTSPKGHSQALISRGRVFVHLGNLPRAIADFTAVIEMPDAPAEQKAKALTNRGVTLHRQGNPQRAIADYTAVIEMPDASSEQKAQALFNRGVTLHQQGNPQRAIADYTTVFEMPDASSEQKAQALVNRGAILSQQGNLGRAIEDFTAVIEMPDASAEQMAPALVNRGITFDRQENLDRAIEDYTAVIEMPDASAEQKALALINRGWYYFVTDRIKEAIADSRQAVTLNPQDASAFGNLAVSLLVDHQLLDGIAAYNQAIELADADVLADLEKDLQDAIAKHGPIAGADEVRKRIEARATTLKTPSARQ